jgi:hypothetical protein
MRRPLLPRAPLQAEVAEEDRRQQERDHRDGERGSLAERSAGDRALERKGRHQVRRVRRPAARQHVDELEIGEGEEHREGHHHGDDRRQERHRHVAELLPRRSAVEASRLVVRRRDRLQAGEQADRDEGHAAPDVGAIVDSAASTDRRGSRCTGGSSPGVTSIQLMIENCAS